MPTYEYKCLECNHHFEVFQSMTAELLTKCEVCGGKVKRLIGPGAGIIFKGSGFYETDYRSKGYRESAQKDKQSTESAPKTDKAKKSKTGDSEKKTKTPSTESKTK